MKRILSLGQCGADHAAIAWLVQSRLQAEVVPAATTDEALAELEREPVALVLVNRVLDWNGESGLDFIRRLKADPALRQIPVMLVSNYDDAQQEAVAAGALAGFGKAALRSAATAERLRAVLDAADPEPAP